MMSDAIENGVPSPGQPSADDNGFSGADDAPAAESPAAPESPNPEAMSPQESSPSYPVNPALSFRRPTADFDHIADLATPKKDYSKETAEVLPPFKPTLMTPESTRVKVTSSGYGSPNYIPKLVKEQKKPGPVEEVVDEKDLTFTPDLDLTKNAREKVTSSAYGSQSAAKKDWTAKQEKPTFKPDMSTTAKGRASVTSTGYGKNLVVKKAVDPKKYAPEFKPKMDFGKGQGKLRNATEARFLAERQRPKTAPAQPAAKVPLMYTLAADHTPPPADREFTGPAFVLNGSMLSSMPSGLSKSDIDQAPPPVTPSAHSKKLKESTTSTGYGTTYTPKQGQRVQKVSEPVLKLGSSASAWIEDPDAIPTVRNKQTETAQASYSPAAYKPATVKREPIKKEQSSAVYIANRNDTIPTEIPSPPKSHKKTAGMVASTGYGVVATAVYDRRDRSESPTRPATAPGAAPATRPSPRADEQTTIL
eukprot:m.143171 g.143171  ORF g.143171 m.143171 type:complete len:476 (-) comp22967_c0_seq1:76-1503(-)